ncbi:hypothetical protein EMEDMD4_910109 [Sinorhizobium medicae]|uniref:Uncharacterized protein n=1 Tax=Sinorhizobium medicae TaxID=110321 RepID=A0A508X7S7_9HYPH|nr:hypothetical protein EMEDMD4_910109 [Sinorhizobium medicae]
MKWNADLITPKKDYNFSQTLTEKILI